MKIKISADSTCDLPVDLAAQYDIGITPLYVVRGGDSLRDGVDITPDDIYAHVAAGGDLCSTAAVSVYDYVEYFRAMRQEYDAVIHFHISSDMSACYQNACIAAEEVDGVYPIDARNLSVGIGIMVLEAAELAREGVLSAPEIVEKILARREQVDVSFVVEQLDYLRKGGRCSSVAALGANLLSLRPCILVKDGKMGVGKKYRGAYQKCLLQYVKERLEGHGDIDTRRIFIANSGGFSDEEVAQVEQAVRACQPFEEVLHTRAGCTISCHCGPRTLGIVYFHKA